MTKIYKDISDLKNLIQLRYLSASVFPTIVGTLLPFWLLGPNFPIDWLSAFEFLFSVVLFHLAFIIFNQISLNGNLESQFRNRVLLLALSFFTLSLLTGLHLNTQITLQKGVPSYIFIVFGFTTFFAGILYVAPPFSFNKRIGGEVIIAEGLGMLPVIGAFLVQVGDIIRSVYIASLPIVVITFLWIWIIEIIQKEKDEKQNKNNFVIYFGLKFAGQYGVVIIVAMFFLTSFAALISATLSPIIIIILLFIWLVWKIILNSRQYYLLPDKMKRVEKGVIQLHTAVCAIIILSCIIML